MKSSCLARNEKIIYKKMRTSLIPIPTSKVYIRVIVRDSNLVQKLARVEWREGLGRHPWQAAAARPSSSQRHNFNTTVLYLQVSLDPSIPLTHFNINMTIMKNHTQFDPASRTGTATPANAGAGPGGAAATFNNDDGQEVTIVNYDNNKDLELDLDLDFENQDGAEDNGNGAALSLKRKSRNSLLKKGLAVSCGFAVVAAAFVIGAEWTTSTMMSKSSVLEPAQAEYVSGRDRSSKSSKTCKALKGEPNGRCGKWDILIKAICAG